jgi:hypothetical protein
MKDAPMTFVAAMMNSMAETTMDFMPPTTAGHPARGRDDGDGTDRSAPVSRPRSSP